MKYTLKTILTATALSFPVVFGADISEGERSNTPSMTDEQRQATVTKTLKYFDYSLPYKKILDLAAQLEQLGAKESVISKAENYLSRTNVQDHQIQDYQILAACMYEGIGETDTAIRLYTSLMKNPKTLGGYLEATANAFDRLNKPGFAIKAFIQMVTTDQTDELKMIGAIKRLEAAGCIEEAATGWEKAIFQTRRLLHGLSAMDTNEGAVFFERHGKLDLAINAYNSVFHKRFPYEPSLPLESTNDSLSQTVDALIRLGRRADAINGLTGILKSSETTLKEQTKAQLILNRIEAI